MPQTLYPRPILRKIIKAHTNRSLSKNVDILVYLNYIVFMQELMKEARILSKQRNERGVSARSIRKVGERTLRGFKG